MTSSPVANIVSSLPPSPAGKAGARPAEGAGNPFGQMLSEEIAGKHQSGNSQAERNEAPASSAPAADKTNTPPASSADKQLAEPGKTDHNTEAPALSPELAAMIAGLLQRHEAAGEALPNADEKTDDPLALLGRALGRHDGETPDTPADLLDARGQTAGKLNVAQADTEIDLQATLARSTATDTAGEEAPSTEFSTTLNQLNQASQAGAARNMQAAAPHVIAPRVGAHGWDHAIAQRVTWMVSGAEQSASLTLNPPELGPLQVVVNVSNSQANATFIAAHAEVRQALEAALPKLREMLGEAGIQLDQASVNQGTPQQQGEFAQSRGQGSGAQANGVTGNEGLPEQAAMTRPVSASGNGLVDTFA